MDSANRTIRVGTNMGVDYCQERNILIPHARFEVHREWDLMAIANQVYYRFFRRPHPKWNWFFLDHRKGRNGLFHFYNCVSSTGKPWIATAESSFTELRSGGFDPVEYLGRRNCRAILHLSRWGYDMQIRQLHPDLHHQMVPKMKILPPPQRLLSAGRKERDFHREIVRFILVGNSFYRKGGYETVLALESLRMEGFRFHLDIVGRMFYGDRNFRAFGEKRPRNLDRIVSENPDHYKIHGVLRNENTLDLIRSCDVGLLPSLKERYGFAVLEYMAAGLPVVTTNQGVFTETNHVSRGWIAQLPLKQQEIPWFTPEEKRTTSFQLVDQLYRIFKEILKNPGQIKEKGRQAILYIAENHDPQAFSREIESIYRNAICKS